MRSRVYESVGHPSVCPIRLLRVCCCEPGGQKISMDSCTGVGSAVNTGSIARSSKCGHRRQRRRGCKGRDPQIFDLQTTTQYFEKCFIFSLQRSFWIPQVAVIFICTISHTILRWKIHKFSGKGHSLSPDPPPRRLRRLDCRVFGARPATPQCSSGVDAPECG